MSRHTVNSSRPKNANQQNQLSAANYQQKIVYDDELDEDFVENVSKTSANELQNITDSFDNPVGAEEDPNLTFKGGPDIDPETLEKMRQEMAAMPKDQLMALFANMMGQKDYGLGENDFSAVSGDHRSDVKKRLQAKLAQKRGARQTNNARTVQQERAQAKSTLLKEKQIRETTLLKEKQPVESTNDTNNTNNADVEDLDGEDNKPHVHSASCSDSNCSHGTKQGSVTPLPRQPLEGKNSEGTLRLGELEIDAEQQPKCCDNENCDCDKSSNSTTSNKSDVQGNRKNRRAANKRKNKGKK